MKSCNITALKSALQAGFCLLLLQNGTALAAEFCSDDYYIDVTLPNQARWDMCWEHRKREGIVLHKIHYTPANGTRHLILNEATVAQIHVPYDDNGARYHDVSDYGLGSNYMSALTRGDCPGGKLLQFGSKPVLCQQTEARGTAHAYGTERLQGDALSLFSVSKVGAYHYIPTWRFLDDGSMEPTMGATGALQRFGKSSLSQHGWLISNDKVGLAHLHNFFWKLDFDLGGTSNDDYVEEIGYTAQNGRTTRYNTRFHSEAARRVDPARMRSWVVADGNLLNGNGQPMGYEIRLPQADHQDTGPATEPFTHNDIYFTRQNNCELYASHNPVAGGCADNLADFVNGDSLDGQDIVVWPSTTFYHMPRTEDAPLMDAHWSHISIVPRDWHDQNPLSNAPPTSGSNPVNTDPDTSQHPAETLVYAEDFEQASGWLANPYSTDTAYAGLWERGQLQQTRYQNTVLQLADAAHGSQALATGVQAGNLVGSHDLDGGTSSLISPGIPLPQGKLKLAFAWYFAHLQNTSADDYLSVSLISSTGQRQLLLEQRGTRAVRPAVWAESAQDISAFAGQTIQLLVEAADAGSGSLIEAAIDHIRITATSPDSDSTGTTDNAPTVIYQTGFETDSGWTLNPLGTDNAYAGQWQQGRPEHTGYQGTTLQPGVAAAGNAALVTGAAAGNAVGANDLDGGISSVRSPAIRLDSGHRYRLELDYYLGHLWNSNAADYLRISVETGAGTLAPILQESADQTSRSASWTRTGIDLSPYAGQTVYLRVEASDGDNGSLVEAGIDNIVITQD